MIDAISRAPSLKSNEAGARGWTPRVAQVRVCDSAGLRT